MPVSPRGHKNDKKDIPISSHVSLLKVFKPHPRVRSRNETYSTFDLFTNNLFTSLDSFGSSRKRVAKEDTSNQAGIAIPEFPPKR